MSADAPAQGALATERQARLTVGPNNAHDDLEVLVTRAELGHPQKLHVWASAPERDAQQRELELQRFDGVCVPHNLGPADEAELARPPMENEAVGSRLYRVHHLALREQALHPARTFAQRQEYRSTAGGVPLSRFAEARKDSMSRSCLHREVRCSPRPAAAKHKQPQVVGRYLVSCAAPVWQVWAGPAERITSLLCQPAQHREAGRRAKPREIGTLGRAVRHEQVRRRFH